MKGRILFVIGFTTVLQAAEPPLVYTPPLEVVKAASQTITAEYLKEIIKTLSSDEMEGRAPGSLGSKKAREFIIRKLKEVGIIPGNAGKWEQKFTLVGINTFSPKTLEFTTGTRKVVFNYWDQFILFAGKQKEKLAVENADVVFVGYGIQAPEYNWDDFKGKDLSGKVLIFLNNDPDWDPQLFEGKRRLYYGRWSYKYEKAAELGAVAAFIIHTTESAGYPWQVVQRSWTGEQFELPQKEDEKGVAVKGWLTYDAAKELFEASGFSLEKAIALSKSRNFYPIELKAKLSVEISSKIRRVEGSNVVGLLKGTSDEVVIYTAHYDHLGISTPDQEGDKIYNGAMDNATGVAQVIAIAKAFSKVKDLLERSILFLIVDAEEQGLLGSKFYVHNPTVPVSKMVVNINYDGGNVWGETADLISVGYGKSPDLDKLVIGYAAFQKRAVKGDQFPDKGFFYRSDQFSFAKAGVPSIWLDGGTEFIGREPGWGVKMIEHWEKSHYHQPSDEFNDEWNFAGMVKDAKLGFYIGYSLATSKSFPMWKKGDEFELLRIKALADK